MRSGITLYIKSYQDWNKARAFHLLIRNLMQSCLRKNSKHHSS
jgi:hypothetical protein